MGQVNIPSGGMRSNVRAAVEIPTDRVWKFSPIEDEIMLCGAGEEADGICLSTVTAGTVCNNTGICYARKDTGVFDEVAHDGTLTTVGAEWMSGADGVISAYVAADDNRPLGKVLSLYEDENGDPYAKVSLYAR